MSNATTEHAPWFRLPGFFLLPLLLTLILVLHLLLLLPPAPAEIKRAPSQVEVGGSL